MKTSVITHRDFLRATGVALALPMPDASSTRIDVSEFASGKGGIPGFTTWHPSFLMKRILLILALPLAFAALASNANARDPGAKTSPSPTPATAQGEMQYARDLAHRVHDEITLYGSNRLIRSQIKKVDDEILQVNREIASHNVDRVQLHTEVVRINDELHTIDLELRDLGVHEPMTLTGGKNSLLR